MSKPCIYVCSLLLFVGAPLSARAINLGSLDKIFRRKNQKKDMVTITAVKQTDTVEPFFLKQADQIKVTLTYHPKDRSSGLVNLTLDNPEGTPLSTSLPKGASIASATASFDFGPLGKDLFSIPHNERAAVQPTKEEWQQIKAIVKQKPDVTPEEWTLIDQLQVD